MTTRRAPAGLVIPGLLLMFAGAPLPAAQQPDQGAATEASAQEPDAAGDQPTFRGGINFVRVDAVVTDGRGRPLLDLEQTDFEILEDGKPQAIEQFSVVSIDGGLAPDESRPRQIRSAGDEEVEAARQDVRVFVFFLDDYHVRSDNARGVRDSLIRFVERQLGPNDLVSVMYPLTPAGDVQFTRNHESIVSALSKFEGRKYDYTPRNTFELNYERESTEVVERVRNSVVMGALESLAVRLGGLREGRKSVIFVSEGFTVLLPPAMRRRDAQVPAFPGAVVTDPRAEEMAEAQAEMEIELRMRDVYRAASRNNTAIYALDPRGLAVFEFDISDGAVGGAISPEDDRRMLQSTQETLRTLALETDGRAILNRNNLDAGLAEMVRDASHYYLIGYTSQAPTDGKFHEIEVTVRRSGASVRARRGFWALTAENVQQLTESRTRDVAKPVMQALATIAPAVQAARFIRTWVGTERGDNGRTRVTLVWEPLPAQPGVRSEEAGSVSILAVDEQGGLVHRARSPEEAAAGSARPQAGAGPAGAGARAGGPKQIVFDAAPGPVEVRLSVEAAGGGMLDSETRTLQVPDLAGGSVALSTPRVYRARTARDFQQYAADGQAIPVAAREFSRTERLLIRFDAYGPGSETPAPVATLLSRTGEKIGDMPVAPAKVGGTHQIDVRLNSMAAGEYLVEVSVTGATGESVSELVPFRIGA